MLPVARFLKYTHLSQAFRSDEVREPSTSLWCTQRPPCGEVPQVHTSLPGIPVWWGKGTVYFTLMYTGSNVLPVARFLKYTHLSQAFRSDEVRKVSTSLWCTRVQRPPCGKVAQLLWNTFYSRWLYLRVNSREHRDAKIKSSPIICNVRIRRRSDESRK